MDARLQRRIQRYGWDKAAAWYEQSWQRQLAPAQGTMLALSGDKYPGSTGALFGLLLTLLQIGGIALPAAIGFVSDRAGLRPGLSIVAVSCVCVAAFVRLSMRGNQVESGSTSEETA